MHTNRLFAKKILEQAEHYEWSLQGLGMLRLYLDDNTRLHVWDRRFAFPGASPIHDHLQWALNSTIISGSMVNVRYTERTDCVRPNQMTHMVGTLKAGYGCYFKDEPKPTRLVQQEPEFYSPGDSYWQRATEIHESKPEDGTVTLMRKTPTEDKESARVFWPISTEWGSAEPRRATIHEVIAITGYALAKWSDG